MANIFGRKELPDKTVANVNKDDSSTHEKKAIDNKHGVVTINSGSMTDYFKSKLNNKLTGNKNLASSVSNNGAIESESENERVIIEFASKIENTLSTKFRDSEEKSKYAFDNPCLGLNSPVDSTSNNNYISWKKSEKVPGKKRKSFENTNLHFNETDKYNVQKKLKTEITDHNCKNAFTNPALNLDTESEENCNGKEFEVSRAEFGLENCALDLTDEKIDKKRVTFSDHIMLYEYKTDSSKKKKKKGQATLDKFEVENRKHKKKRKHESITTAGSDGFINEGLDVENLCDEINDNELNEHRNKKFKKRKICKISSLETIQESPEQEKEIIDIEPNTEPEVITLENEEMDITNQKSKRKKKKKIDIEEIIKDDIKNEEPNIKIIENEEIKRDKNKKREILILKKSKKKKKKDKENCKSELKHTVKTGIGSDKKNIDITKEKPNLKQVDHSIGIEDEDAIEIDMLPIKFEAQVDIKQKKKNNSIDDEEDRLKNETSICNVEGEISDKENADKDQDSKKLTKKDKKRKKL